MALICMKCGGEEYYTYRDFPDQEGIKKCRKCGCEMIDPREYLLKKGGDNAVLRT